MTAELLLINSPAPAMAMLCLNRPERRNALTIELMQALCGALERLASDGACRVVILRGAGPAFCAGLDLHEAAEPDMVERGAEWVGRLFATVMHSPLVTIAAAQGAAYAGGAGLMSACDLVVAASDLRIGFPEVRRGLVGAFISAVLRDKLTMAKLRELLLLAEPVDAEHALRLGLVNRVVPAADLLEEARRMAATVLQGAPDAVRQTKALLLELRSTDPAQSMEWAVTWHQRARCGAEAAEGIAAWREGRPPRW